MQHSEQPLSGSRRDLNDCHASNIEMFRCFRGIARAAIVRRDEQELGAGVFGFAFVIFFFLFFSAAALFLREAVSESSEANICVRR